MAGTARSKAKTRKPAPVAEVPEEVDEEKDYTVYLDKPATDLQERFAVWIKDVTGYEPNDDDDFAAGVQLATALRMEFQRSPENQAVLEERRAAAEAAKEEKASQPAKKRGRPAKATKVAEEDEPDVEEVDEDVEEEKPVAKRRATRAKAGATTKTATKTAATRARRARPASKAKAAAGEAPF